MERVVVTVMLFISSCYGQGGNTCTDVAEYCQYWKTLGECKNNPIYMIQECPSTCKTCDGRLLSMVMAASEQNANQETVKRALEALEAFQSQPECAVEHCYRCGSRGQRCASDGCEEGYVRTRTGRCRETEPECTVEQCSQCTPGSSGLICAAGGCRESYTRSMLGKCIRCNVDNCNLCGATGTMCSSEGCKRGYDRTPQGQCVKQPPRCNVEHCNTCVRGGRKCTMRGCESGYIKTRQGRCVIPQCNVDNCRTCVRGGNKCTRTGCESGYAVTRQGQCEIIQIQPESLTSTTRRVCTVAHCIKCSMNGRYCKRGGCAIGFSKTRQGQCVRILRVVNSASSSTVQPESLTSTTRRVCTVANCTRCSKNGRYCKRGGCATGFSKTRQGQCVQTESQTSTVGPTSTTRRVCTVAHCTRCTSDGNTCARGGCARGYPLTEQGQCVRRECAVANCTRCSMDGRKCAQGGCATGFSKTRQGQCVRSRCNVGHCNRCTTNGRRCVTGGCESGYALTSRGQCETTSSNALRRRAEECNTSECILSFLSFASKSSACIDVAHCTMCDAGGHECMEDGCETGYNWAEPGQCTMPARTSVHCDTPECVWALLGR